MTHGMGLAQYLLINKIVEFIGHKKRPIPKEITTIP